MRISQEQIAFQAKVRSTTISNYINQKSSPGIEEFVEICHYFGISPESFLFQNFEKGGVITDQYIEDFKKKGRGNGGIMGGVMAKKPTIYQPENSPLSTVNEGEETMIWAVMNTLRQMDRKLDQLLTSGEHNQKKKG